MPPNAKNQRTAAAGVREALVSGRARRTEVLMAQGGAVALPSNVTGWLRNLAAPGALASWSNVLSPSVPAVQPTAGRQAASEVGGSVLFDGGDVYSWPLIANMNKNVSTLGFAMWFEPASLAAINDLLAIHTGTGGASVSTWIMCSQSNNFRLDVKNNGLVGRRGAAVAVLTVGVPAFITCEFNGNMPTEATRHVITINGVVQTLSFSAISGGVSATALNDPTGNILIGGAADADVGVEPILNGGRLSMNVWAGTSALPAVTEGIWTPAARAGLMALEPLT
jgi:hypothetical protein